MSAAITVQPSGMSAGTALTGLREIENDVLGAILREPSRLTAIAAEVGAEHFSTPLGQRLFEAIGNLARAGEAVALPLVATRVGVYAWDEPGGVDAYLESLLARRTIGNAELIDEARAIRQASETRDRDLPLYNDDVVAWAHEQRRLLEELSRRPDLPPVDWVNVIEEILSVGRSEVSGVARRIELVFVHLMKIASSPDASSVGRWRQEIELHLDRLQSDYRPSMRRLIDVDRVWARARIDAARQLDEFGERLSRSLPETSPITLHEIVRVVAADDLMAKLSARSRG